jgi:hypothetical protein
MRLAEEFQIDTLLCPRISKSPSRQVAKSPSRQVTNSPILPIDQLINKLTIDNRQLTNG